MHSTHSLIVQNILPLHTVINFVCRPPEFHYSIPLHFLSLVPLTQETDTEKIGKTKSYELMGVE